MDRRSVRRGFTLVEMLIVISIIGILVGLLAAGLNAARVAILKRAQTAEIANLVSAIEAYRNKYGDYPPDGSSWPAMQAHLRKNFQDILVTELNLLDPSMASTVIQKNAIVGAPVRNDNDASAHPFGGRVMDPAEALVFALGGYSNNSQQPLTGPGGPFSVTTDASSNVLIRYNSQRANSFFDFKQSQLTLVETPAGLVSSDETIYGEGVLNDLLPVYVGQGPTIAQGGVPIVYFNSQTYIVGGAYFNFYVPGPAATGPNCARPFLANEVQSQFVGTVKPQRFANDTKFQLLNAGYDKLYGCQSVPSAVSSSLTLFTCPGGVPCTVDVSSGVPLFFAPASPPLSKYYLPEFGNLHPVDDNISNFIDGPTFAESR